MQGYADLQRPAAPIQHVAVVAPPALVAALASEGAQRGIAVEDAHSIVPPTRQYTDAEVQQLLGARGVDGVLVVAVADSGAQERYAGTIMSSNYIGNGAVVASSAPVYQYGRSMTFQVRLADPKTSRILWTGNGQTNASGSLFMADATSARDAAAAIFKDLQEKGLVAAAGA